MKQLIFLILLAGFVFGTDACWAAEDMPYHPYRKVGDKYYTLQPLYDWHNLMGKVDRETRTTQEMISRDKKIGQLKANRPMKEWVGGYSSACKAVQILPDGLLMEYCDGLQTEYNHGYRSGYFLLKNYPNKDKVIDGRRILFFAIKTGNYQYTDTAGANRTVELYDYGVPYDPKALALEQKAKAGQTNPTTNASPARTNSIQEIKPQPKN